MKNLTSQTLLIMLLLLITNFSFGQIFCSSDSGTSSLNFSGHNDFKIAFQSLSSEGRSVQMGYGFLEKFNFSAGLFDYQFEEFSENDSLINVNGNTFTSSIGISHFLKNPDMESTINRYHNDTGLLLLFNIGYTYGKNLNTIEERFFSDFRYHKAFATAGLAFKTKFINFNAQFKYAIIQYSKGKIFGSWNVYYDIINAFQFIEAQNGTFNTLEFNLQGEIGIRQIKTIGGFSINLIGIDPHFFGNRHKYIYIGILVEIDDIIKYRKKNQ